ncbi:DUF92 domain-containing protein [Fictibacillus nanhaiensis]|uniref:DUF92 domain-containing protein n=1 Tax=Fictibacillus nanhaiensis TaxID=742169 RepID=UPI001C939142|nr:DUF92 domain-containing protein [Fictibacillus nanhaiensis]MBY6035498.1 DUF92 domain-containing protein [Fictibacillus nanhaiensis]
MDAIFFIGILSLCIVSIQNKMLTPDGGIAAFFTGLFIFLSFQWQGLVILGLFFLTSSLLTKWKKNVKRDPDAVNSEYVKGRNARQVFANGGTASLAAAGQLIHPDPVWFIMYAAAFATATADTWASEIGVLSKRRPFHLKEWRKVERGLSGAVSTLGTFAAILGASVIGLSYQLLYEPVALTIIITIITAGFLGNFADTLIGAWLEQKFYCSICKRETEEIVHCHSKTVKIFGYSWATNNFVNFSATIVGALIAGGTYIWIIK